MKKETSMQKYTLLVVTALVVLSAGFTSLQSRGPQAGRAADEQTTREIAEQIKMRHAALQRHDRVDYSVFLDQSAVFAEPGEVNTGVQQLAEARPTLGVKKVIESDAPKVTSFGRTVVAVYRQSEKEIYGEQSLTHRWMVVETYLKKDDNWLLIAHVQVPEPLKRKSVEVSPALLAQYAGQYEWGPGFVDTISLAGGKLLAQTTNEDKPDELLALNETTFFEDGDGDESLVVFEKGATGKVSGYVLRSRGGEIIAKKIK